MIYFIIKGHELQNEIQSIVQVFYPNMHYQRTSKVQTQGITIINIIKNGICKSIIYENGKKLEEASIDIVFSNNKYLNDKKREIKRFIKTSVYILLSKVTLKKIPWGILTGIRPAKNVIEFLEKGASNKEILEILTQKYLASEDKIQLAIRVAETEKKILNSNVYNTAGLYIGIPFCPTRCLYCSFTSYPLYQYSNKVDNYLTALTKEIKYISTYFKNYILESIYIGGGTPTSLNEKQLEHLLLTIKEYFNLSNIKEFTIEAGRPDTITKTKLKIIKNYGINRISINPQTMNQNTLDLIGRKHTVKDINDIFYLSRCMGYDNINMDIILGLPQETPESVQNTMKKLELLSPDSITVHTLAVKRASRLKETIDNYKFVEADIMEKMLKISSYYSHKMNMYPYYMYRQKNMIGDFENIGYCKPKKECIYNIKIMEEKQTILSAGAGATTKIVYPNGRIERIFNVKSVDDYINRIDDMIKRKENNLPII